MTYLVAAGRAACLGIAFAISPTSAAKATDMREPPSPVAFFQGSSVSAGSVRTLWLFEEGFTASFRGQTMDGHLELDERFRFEDGQRLQRWDLTEREGAIRGQVFTEDGNGELQGPFPVTGTATDGTMVLTYRGIAPGGGRFSLDFRHEMTPNDDGTLANRVRVSRFGLTLARSDVTFAKTERALQAHVSASEPGPAISTSAPAR